MSVEKEWICFGLDLKIGSILPVVPNFMAAEIVELKILRIVILSLVLSGCSTYDNLKSYTVPYQEPEHPTSARIRVSTDQVVRLIPGSDCLDWRVPGAGVVNSRAIALANNREHNDKRIGMPPGDQLDNNSEVYVKPNEPITIVYNGAAHRTECSSRSYFLPQENSDYEISARYSRVGCYIAVSKLVGVGGDGKVILESAGARNANVCSR